MANLLSGTIAVIYAVQDKLEYAALFVALGVFFDFFDGFFARLFKVAGPLGLQLDSLADMVTSGVVPGIVMYQLMEDVNSPQWGEGDAVFKFSLLGLAITLASAYRLAKFNIDTRQTSSFIGLPTPANTLFILSLPLILQYSQLSFAIQLLESPFFLLLLTLASCYILNAELPLFSLKFSSYSFRLNWFKYLFLICALLFLITLKYVGVPLVIILYVILSLLVKGKH